MKFLLLTIMLVLAGPAIALDPKVPLAELAVDTWGRRDGLPSDTANAVAVMADAMVWIGTEQGLVAFDGVAMTRYSVANTPELPSNIIMALQSDGEALWIGTAGGLARWRGGVFEHLKRSGGAPITQVTQLARAAPGHIWLQSNGIFEWRDDALEPWPRSCHDAVPIGQNDIVVAPDGALVVAADSGIWRCFGGVATKLSDLAAVSLAVSPDGTLWAGVQHEGVYRLVPTQVPESSRQATFVHELVVPREARPSVYIDRAGALWVGGTGPGVTRRGPTGELESLTLPDGTAPTDAQSLAEGADGSLLLGTFTSGLVRLRQGPFRVRDARSGVAVPTVNVFEDHGGTLWSAGSADTTLLATKARTTRRYDLPLPALAHLETVGGRHLVATPAGLFEIVGDKAERVPLGVEIGVVGLAESPDGALWLAAAEQGTYRFANGAAIKIQRPTGERIQALTIMLARDQKTVWVGTDEDLCRIDGADHGIGPVTCFQGVGAPSVSMLSLYEDTRRSLWAATYGAGIVRLRNGRAVAITERHGLPSDNNYFILADDAGNLWVSCATGVTRVALADLDAVADGRADSVDARLFGSADGLPIDETNGGGMSAARAADGRLWFPTPRGAVVVDPRAAERRVESPRAVIELVRVGALTLPRAGGEVPSEHRDLLVRFTAPTLDRPAELRFRYRLDDAPWTDSGSMRSAQFTDLSPGHHAFRVQAMAPLSAGFGPEATFTVDMAARLDETLGFRLTLVALGLALLYGAYRMRLAGLVRRETELARQVAVRTRELAAAQGELVAVNGNLEALNVDLERRVAVAVDELRAAERMAAYGQTIAGVAHEVRQPLFALGTTAFVLGDKLRDRPDLKSDLQLLERETKRMNRVMDEMLDFAKPRGLLLAEASVAALLDEAIEIFRAEHDPEGKVAVAVTVAPDVTNARLDSERMQQVLVNLLSNAKHHATGMSGVHITARHEGAHLALEVADDGKGIAAADLVRVFDPFFTTSGIGLGLAIVRRIIEDHRGTIVALSSARGTTFRIMLPTEVP